MPVPEADADPLCCPTPVDRGGAAQRASLERGRSTEDFVVQFLPVYSGCFLARRNCHQDLGAIRELSRRAKTFPAKLSKIGRGYRATYSRGERTRWDKELVEPKWQNGLPQRFSGERSLY